MLKTKIIIALIMNNVPNMDVAIVRNFSIPLFVWNPEKSPPKVAESPVPLFCKRMDTNSIKENIN